MSGEDLEVDCVVGLNLFVAVDIELNFVQGTNYFRKRFGTPIFDAFKAENVPTLSEDLGNPLVSIVNFSADLALFYYFNLL